MKNIVGLIAWVAVSFSAGWFGSQFKPGIWYQELGKPGWTPPSLVFPVAWSLLYMIMGVSAWLVWERRPTHPMVPLAITVFIVQLILNALWSWIFFGYHEIGWAFFEMAGLWVAVALTIGLFWRVSSTAGFLLIPYLTWVTFALALNGAIWRRN